MRQALILIFLIMTIGCGIRYDPAGTDVIAPSYAVGGGEWDSGGGITSVASVFGRNGRTVICGVWMMDQQSVLSDRYNEDVIAASSAYAGNIRVVRNLSFMQKIPYTDNVTGRQATCVFSDLPWTEQLSGAPVRIRFPRLSFGGNLGSGFGLGFGGIGVGSGDRVTFRQTPRPNPVR